MKGLAAIGVVLIALGILALAFQRIGYKDREEIIDVGPIKATAERQKVIVIPPVVGAAAVITGVILLIIGLKKT